MLTWTTCCFWLKLQVIETFFKERHIIIRDEIVGGGVQIISVVAVTIISTMTENILNSINVVVKCQKIELARGTSRRSFILAWNTIGSMWWNMMGTTCKSEATRFSTIVVELDMALKSPYKDYERLGFSMPLSKSNCWFSFGSSSNIPQCCNKVHLVLKNWCHMGSPIKFQIHDRCHESHLLFTCPHNKSHNVLCRLAWQ